MIRQRSSNINSLIAFPSNLQNRVINPNRRGVVVVLAAVMLVFLLGFVAFTVDVGYVQLTKTQLQAAADASALAAAQELSGTDTPEVVRTNARASAQAIAGLYRNGNLSSVTLNTSTDIIFGKTSWNANTNTYTYLWGDNQTPYNVIKVLAKRTVNGSSDNRLPLLFGPVLGTSSADITAESVATFQPRDIMLVLDFSSSMNDDSSLGAIGDLGRSYVENNLLTMYQELGSPVYGNLTFTPQYAKLRGRTASGTIPHIQCTYRRKSIIVTSTLALSQVRLQFSDGATQTFSSLSGLTGTYSGTGGNSNKEITNCWVRSGTNGSLSSGNLGEKFDFTAANIKTALGLNGTYPYPGGSWSEYITSVQSSSTTPGGSGSGDIGYAGYRDMYGYLTWINYLQTQREQAYDTTNLWQTSEQPVGALKDASKYFIDYIIAQQSNDQVGLSIYTHPNSPGAILEQGLTTNLSGLKTTLTQRQAGHYNANTNISAGMTVARQEIEAHARLRTFRTMVLMTDGQANLPGTSTQAKAAVVTEANLAAASKIKILTISVGVDADTSLMQQVADITGGLHFIIPGNQTAASMKTQLQDAFQQIASTRPLKLVSGQ